MMSTGHSTLTRPPLQVLQPETASEVAVMQCLVQAGGWSATVNLVDELCERDICVPYLCQDA